MSFSEVLSDFLNDEFQVQDYATKVIQNAAISKQLAQLFDGISMLDKELQSQVVKLKIVWFTLIGSHLSVYYDLKVIYFICYFSHTKNYNAP